MKRYVILINRDNEISDIRTHEFNPSMKDKYKKHDGLVYINAHTILEALKKYTDLTGNVIK